MKPFSIQLMSLPDTYEPGSTVELQGAQRITLRPVSEIPSMMLSFEESGARLSKLPQMLFEMDGSWVWSGQLGKHPWQLDGMIYDRDGHLQYAQVKGTCTLPAWRELITCIGWPEQSLLIHLVEQGSYLDLRTFEQTFFNVN